MDQKINLNILNNIHEKTKKYDFKWIEKKKSDNSIYSKKNKELQSFINKFFKNHCIIINSCKLLYLNCVFQIFVSYCCYLKFFYKKKKSTIHIKKLNNNIVFNLFFKKLFLSILNFFKKKLNFLLITKKLKNNFKKIINIWIKKILWKKLTNFRKYKQAIFFKESINIVFTFITNKKASKLISQFLTETIQKLKHHNFFLRFIWHILKIFIISPVSWIQGMWINIKGCLNNRPWAINQKFNFNNGVSLNNLNYKAYFYKQTAFNINGTIGIKIWTHDLFKN